MSDFKFNCPHCSQSLEASEEMLGETIDCPICNGRIELPNPEQPHRQAHTNINNLVAREIVSKVGEIFADFNEQGQLVKPRSSLPCSWFAVRECFMNAYETDYLEVPKDLRFSYHLVYRELSFFIDDDLCEDFNSSWNIAAKCAFARFQALGIPADEAFCKNYIASHLVTSQDRKEIWANLAREETCPRQHLLLLWEILAYCSELHRVMWNEWAAFENLLAYRKNIKQCE